MSTELEKLRIDDPAVIFPLSGQIRFSTRSEIEYAYYESRGFRREGKVYHDSIYLGRVISKTESLYFNNNLNFFNFTLDNGFVSRPDLTKVTAPECLRLRFGDVWVYDDILKGSNLYDVITNISPSDSDTLHALLIFRLSNPEAAYNNASCWFDRSYARILYPNASLSSSSISLMLDKLGDDHFYREFTSLYINYLYKINNNNFDFPILIDTTWLENDINTHLTKISNHSGEINKEIRLIYVVDRNSGLPIFYKVISGNIVDVSILKTTLHCLNAYSINVSFIIMDAGFYSESNLLELNALGIPFLTRLKANQTIYKNIIDEHSSSLFNNIEYLIEYNKRYLFCKKIKINIKNSVFYAYLCIDINKFSLDLHNLINKSSIIDYINNDIKDDNDNKYINNVSKEIDNVGRFILISNQDIDHREVIRHYYSRQQIEQVFDISKNHCGLLPLRGHSEDVIKGHLMVSFIASIITLFINKKLYDVKLSSLDVFFALKNLYINIYDQSSIIDEPTKHENDIINILNLQTTHKIEVRKYNNTKLSNLTVRRKPGRPKGRLGRLIKFKQSSPTPISSTDNLNNSNHTCIETGFSEGSNVLVKPKRGRPLGSRNKSKQPDNDLSSERLGTQDKPKRGRPLGSRNKTKQPDNDLSSERLGTQDKPKRGRPLGSRNKTKQSDDSLPSEGSGAINKPKRGSPLGSHNK